MYVIRIKTKDGNEAWNLLERSRYHAMTKNGNNIEVKYLEYNEIPLELIPFISHPTIPELKKIIMDKLPADFDIDKDWDSNQSKCSVQFDGSDT